MSAGVRWGNDSTNSLLGAEIYGFQNSFHPLPHLGTHTHLLTFFNCSTINCLIIIVFWVMKYYLLTEHLHCLVNLIMSSSLHYVTVLKSNLWHYSIYSENQKITKCRIWCPADVDYSYLYPTDRHFFFTHKLKIVLLRLFLSLPLEFVLNTGRNCSMQ